MRAPKAYLWLCRNSFAEVARTSGVLVDTLHSIGSDTPVNIDVAIQVYLFVVLADG